MGDTEQEVYIFCNQTSNIHCGIAGDDAPKSSLESLIAENTKKEYFFEKKSVFLIIFFF